MEAPIFCRRCAVELTPGRGDFYVVRVEAFADPSPPILDRPEADHDKVMRDLLGELERYSERELMDMVHRRLSFFLCGACYREWIEHPAR